MSDVEKNEVCEVPGPDLFAGRESMDTINPQNWSKSAKLRTYLTICCFTFLANVNASNLTVATVPLMKEFGVSLSTAGHAVCFNVLLFGCGNIVWVPLSKVLGLRPVYLLSLALLIGSNCWSGNATTFSSLLASRIVSGFAASAADATVPAVVAVLFPVTVRSRYLIMFHVALSSGLFIGPMISGLFIHYQSWRWSCYFVAIASGVVLIVGIFTIRETVPHKRNIKKSGAWRHVVVFFMPLIDDPRPMSCIFKDVATIVALAAYPNILWVSFTIGVCVGWNIVVMLTIGSTFASPPYLWNVDKIGVLCLSGFVGAVAAYLLAGRLVDYIFARMNRPGQAIRPENRLPALILPAIIGPIGLIVFGEAIAKRLNWVGAAFGLGMEAFGLTAISNILVVYVVDHYKPFAGEALVIVFIIRNTISVICSLYASDWLALAGVINAFGEMVGIESFFLCLTIPFFFYGRAVKKLVSSYGVAKNSLDS